MTEPWRSRIVGHGEERPEQLLANPRNWRIHPKAQQDALAGVLAEVGWVQHVIVNQRTGHVVDGHARIEIAISRGEPMVPVVYVDLDENEEGIILAALDPLAAMAATDQDKLEALLAELTVSDEALRAMLAPPDEPAEGNTDPDAVPETPAKPTTQPGDLWLLGEHRLLCGDATKAQDVARLMAGERAIVFVTDPPYGVAYTDKARVAAERAHGRLLRVPKWEDGIENDERTDEAIQPFLQEVFRVAVAHALAPNAAWYLWHAMLTQGFFAAAAAAADVLLHRQIIWVKPSLLFGFGDYHWRHELCFYGWVRGSRPPFLGARNQTTVWEITHDTSNDGREHPTQKPVELFERAILNHAQPGEVCYEPFSGSGSQLIAAERTGRRCYAMEIEPKYVDVAVRRWEEFTGKKAKRG